jgi:two-component system response regulator YesN
MNFSRYFNNKRVETAKNMLKETDMTVDSIATNVGFVDPKHFSKVFKRFTGVTPKEFRYLA